MLERFGENLPEREVKFAPCDLKRVEADGTFAGYASLFGEVDLGQDLVMPGAFRDSLRARGTQGVKLLFQHDPNEPIGVWLILGFAFIIGAFVTANMLAQRSTRRATTDVARVQQMYEPLARHARELGTAVATFDRAVLAYLRSA